MSDLKRTKYLRDLRRGIVEHFDLDELEMLAFDLALDWGELRGETKSAKAQSLIMQLARHGRLSALVTLLMEERPSIQWPQPPPPEQQIEDEQAIIPDSERETAFQAYLDKINHYVVAKRTEQGSYPGYAIALARAYTEAILNRLDSNRLAIVIRFLGDIEIVSRLDLGNLVLGGVDLQGATLKESRLQAAKLNDANLEEVDLQWADLQEVDLKSANLQKANLCGAKLYRADLSEADLYKANLEKAKLVGVNLQNARLTRSNLQSADLRGADLKDANLADANLRNAIVRGANLKAENVANADWQGAKYNDETDWPAQFDPEAAGAIAESS